MQHVINQSARHRFAWRAFWVAALLAHAPVTLTLVQGAWAADPEVSASRLIFLSACNLFCLLEIAFAPSLRLIRDRRVAIALLLVVAILHAGVIERGLPDLLAARDAQLWLFLTAAGAASLVWRRWFAALRRTLLRLCQHQDHNQSLHSLYERSLAFLNRRPTPQSSWRILPPRAPPIAC